MVEAWKIVDGYPNYIVSTLGRVKNRTSGRILKPSKMAKGYLTVGLTVEVGDSRTLRVHRLVAKAFVPGEAPGLEVNHMDGDKENNRASNLEWVTGQENIRHAMALGLIDKNGPRNRRSVEVVETGEVFRSQTECAEALGVSQPSVSWALVLPSKRRVKGFHIRYQN